MTTEQTAITTDTDIFFCVAKAGTNVYGEFSKTAHVNAGETYDIKFKGDNIPDIDTDTDTITCHLVFELGDDDESSAAITSDDIGDIVFDTQKISRVPKKASELKIKNRQGDPKIEFEIKSFKVINSEGDSEIKLMVDEEFLPVSLLLKKEKEKIKPSITDFKANGYFVVNGSDVTLNWEIANATEFKLQYGKETKLFTGTALSDRTLVVKNVQDINRFTLIAENGPDNSVSGEVEIKAFGKPEIIAQGGFFPERSRVLSTFCHEYDGEGKPLAIKKLYAFVQTGPESKMSQLYVAMPNPVQRWEEVTTVAGDNVVLDVEIASRPYAVLKDRLIFTGGSSYHPDRAGNTYCIFDINKKELIETNVTIKDASNGKLTLTPRIGHNCVLHNGSVWIIGGYNPDYENSFTDIWKYDGSTWTRLKEELPFDGRCLMGACSWTFQLNDISTNGLWMYGGYPQSPCGDVGTQLYYMDDRNQFHKIECAVKTGHVDTGTLYYNAVELQVLRGKLYLFANGAYKIDRQNNEWVCTKVTDDLNGWVYPVCGHKLQTVTFANVIWLNALHDYSNEQRQEPAKLGKMYYACFV